MNDICDMSASESGVEAAKKLTKSKSKDMKMTRKICFLLAGDTGNVDIFKRRAAEYDVTKQLLT